MTQLVQQIINGVSLGSIYALIALGYTMVYGIINLINFAHGDVYMVGAYIGYAAVVIFHLNFLTALALSMVLCGIAGVVIEKVAYKPLRNASRISVLITAISVSLFLEYGMMYFVKAESKQFPDLIKDGSIKIMGGKVLINTKDIYIVTITIILMVILQFIIYKTKTGKAMRAVSIDTEAAQLMGINVDKTISITFAIGSALAGAAGVLVGVYYNTINPLMGITPGLKAFVAAVVGGIGIVPGAVLGGYFLGMIETMISQYGSSMYKDAAAFIILIVMLLLKPNGLLGHNVKEKV